MSKVTHMFDAFEQQNMYLATPEMQFLSIADLFT